MRWPRRDLHAPRPLRPASQRLGAVDRSPGHGACFAGLCLPSSRHATKGGGSAQGTRARNIRAPRLPPAPVETPRRLSVEGQVAASRIRDTGGRERARRASAPSQVPCPCCGWLASTFESPGWWPRTCQAWDHPMARAVAFPHEHQPGQPPGIHGAYALPVVFSAVTVRADKVALAEVILV
jgi:hypothetical protein